MTTTLQERLDGQKLPHPQNTECLKNIYLRFKKKKKANNQYHLPFYDISEVVPIIKVAKVTNNLRDDQLK